LVKEISVELLLDDPNLEFVVEAALTCPDA
jgi:hypothetical protein